MRLSLHPIDLFDAAPLAHPAFRAIVKGLAMIKAISEPLRSRLKAPLIPPPHFGSAREYRTWKASRSARPQTPGPLQWPLGVWLLLGLVLTLWVGSFLS